MNPRPATGTGGLPPEGIPLPVVRGRSAHPPVAPAAPAAHPPVERAPGPFQPLLLVFTCNWCSYRAADLAGTARMKYPPNVRLIRFMCAGRLDPAFVLKAYAEGADGVVVTGCWPADCHYRIQNVKALRRFLFLRRVIAGLGIEPERLQLVYASAAEGQRLAAEFTRIVEEVRALGPLGWRDRREPVTGGSDTGGGVADAGRADDDGFEDVERRGPVDLLAVGDGSESPAGRAEVTA